MTEQFNKWVWRACFAVLICGTVLTLLLILSGIITNDPEGKLMGIGFGSIGACAIAPLWCVYRRLPLWPCILILVALLLGLMELNAWAERVAQTENERVQSHFHSF